MPRSCVDGVVLLEEIIRKIKDLGGRFTTCCGFQSIHTTDEQSEDVPTEDRG